MNLSTKLIVTIGLLAAYPGEQAYAASVYATVHSRIDLGQTSPQTKYEQGHRLPIVADLVFHNGAKRTVYVIGSHMGYAASDDNFAVNGLRTGKDSSNTRLWIDQISTITTDPGQTHEHQRPKFTMKDGSIHQLELGLFVLKVQSLPGDTVLERSNSGDEQIWFSDVAKLTFRTSTRKDKLGNTMKIEWKYSPFTGEKLPELDR